MRIASVHAATVTNQAALGRTSGGFDPDIVADSMNPLGGDPRFQGPRFQGPRFQGPRFQGPRFQGPRFQGPRFQGPRFQGPRFQGPRFQGPRFQGPRFQGPRFQGDAARFWPAWSDVVCIVTAVDGTWGLGTTSHAGPVVPLINDYLGPLVVGLDGGDLDLLWDLMTVSAGSHFGLSGLTSYAISAVDLALWDLRGKHESVPVYELLGGPARPALDCYATGNDVGAYVSAGFNAVKLACRWGPDREAAVVSNVDRFLAARETVGPEIPVRVDGWAIQDPTDAIALGQALAPHGVDWLEDYVFPEAWTAYGEVRRGLPDTRLASGERWYGVAPFELAVEQAYVEILQPDALWVGGATATVRIAALAEEGGLPLALHCAGNDPYGQHLALALAPNSISEMYYGGAIPADLMATLRPLPGMAAPLNGRITPNDAPGFGIELSLEDLRRATA